MSYAGYITTGQPCPASVFDDGTDAVLTQSADCACLPHAAAMRVQLSLHVCRPWPILPSLPKDLSWQWGFEASPDDNGVQGTVRGPVVDASNGNVLTPAVNDSHCQQSCT